MVIKMLTELGRINTVRILTKRQKYKRVPHRNHRTEKYELKNTLDVGIPWQFSG